MQTKVVVSSYSSCRNLPVMGRPVGVDIHLRVIKSIVPKIFASIEDFAIEVVMEAQEGVSGAAGRKTRCRAEFVA